MGSSPGPLGRSHRAGGGWRAAVPAGPQSPPACSASPEAPPVLQLPPASRPLEPLPVEPPQAHLPPRNTPGLRLTIYMQIRSGRVSGYPRPSRRRAQTPLNNRRGLCVGLLGADSIPSGKTRVLAQNLEVLLAPTSTWSSVLRTPLCAIMHRSK